MESIAHTQMESIVHTHTHIHTRARTHTAKYYRRIFVCFLRHYHNHYHHLPNPTSGKWPYTKTKTQKKNFKNKKHYRRIVVRFLDFFRSSAPLLDVIVYDFCVARLLYNANDIFFCTRDMSLLRIKNVFHSKKIFWNNVFLACVMTS